MSSIKQERVGAISSQCNCALILLHFKNMINPTNSSKSINLRLKNRDILLARYGPSHNKFLSQDDCNFDEPNFLAWSEPLMSNQCGHLALLGELD